MGDLKIPVIPTWISLPPGANFYPTEEQLVFYYLNSKNDGSNYYGIDVIREIDFYDFEPFNLPETTCFRFGREGRRRHWYCYVRRIVKERVKRRAGAGYWKKTRRVRDVVSRAPGKVTVGTRTKFVFYLGDSAKNAVKTAWVMYEYALGDQNMDSFVLCRVFLKSHLVNNLTEHIGVSSCGDDSIASVHRSVGVQIDGTATSMIAESKMHNNSLDNNDEDLKFSSGVDTDNLVTHEPVTEKELIAILEEDFIELNDLLCPLSGID